MYKCYFLKMFILSKLFARFNITPTKLQWDLILFSLNLGDLYLFFNKYLLKYNTYTENTHIPSIQLTELCFTLLRISQLFFSAPFSSQGSSAALGLIIQSPWNWFEDCIKDFFVNYFIKFYKYLMCVTGKNFFLLSINVKTKLFYLYYSNIFTYFFLTI